jgi:predicted molibdopterin-dependent oxidoreductase YjgC
MTLESILTNGADGIDVLYICDARFSERAKDPAVLANLRKAKFLIVHSWDATHPLCDIADVLIPGATHAEKEGTYVNVQGREQRIHQAFLPKGQAETDLEALRRVGERLFELVEVVA